ncbi:MAG TPA: regulator SirB [Gammaproteobacteria bacterium]|nr:regulator SirB [Gammaproteobacteria bacterium]
MIFDSTLIHLIKSIHIATVVLSGMGFFVRGLWMMNQSALRNHPLVKIAPHVNDTLLLVSAITLAYLLKISPITHAWLAAKIIALILYILLGMVAFRFARKQSVRVMAWIAAMFTFAYIVNTAIHKQIWISHLV